MGLREGYWRRRRRLSSVNMGQIYKYIGRHSFLLNSWVNCYEPFVRETVTLAPECFLFVHDPEPVH